MRYLALLLALALAGCANTLRPEAPAPDAELIARLLAIPVPQQALPSQFALNAPHTLLWNAPFRVACYVPESLGPGLIRFGLEGVQMRGPKPIETVENSVLIKGAECGTWKATCLVKLGNGATRYLEQDIQVVGGMCEGDK
jgi:hypothetical protein